MVAAASLAGAQASAQELFAYVATPLPAGTDTLVSVPVNNDVEAELTTDSVAGSVINVPAASLPGGAYDAGSFVNYYVRFIDGPAAGLWSSITANSDSSITIDNPAVAALATAAGGDTIRIYEHHTVGSVFPADQLDDSDGGLLTTGAVANGLQIQFFSDADTQNKAPGSDGAVSFSVISLPGNTIAAWNVPDRPLLPETAFVVRNNSGEDLQYIQSGAAPDHPVAFLAESGVVKDTHRGLGYPVSLTVLETGLGAGTANRQVLTQGTAQNSAPGTDGSTATYLGFAGAWNTPNLELQPFAGFVFRQTSASDAGGKVDVVKPY